MARTTKKRTSSSARSSGSRKSTSSGSRKSNGSSRGRSRNGSSDEVERYRQAAEDALQQLDWTIGYLHGIRKTDISAALAKNRSFIRSQLMGEADEPLPDLETDET
jgi:hypothetical protein